MATIEAALAANPGYTLHIVGHSLGGGCAAVAASLLRETPAASAAARGAIATAFAPPASVTYDMAVGCKEYVTSVVMTYDVVPRTCLANLRALLKELTASEGYKHALQ